MLKIFIKLLIPFKMIFEEVKLSFQPIQPWSEILVAYLSQMGYDSFCETDSGLNAYIESEQFSAEKLHKLISSIDTEVSFVHQKLKDENWNSKWESNFTPVVIDNRCAIRASFHEPIDVEHEIVITPKMSFGTGHHATTSGMVRAMMDLDFDNINVLDMGCGTSVLAILASKLGAKNIVAIDINEWAFENSLENLTVNGVENVQVLCGDAELINNQFDVILANINRNVLLNDMNIYSKALVQNGIILFSGFYRHDLDLMIETANSNNLDFCFISSD